MNKEAAGRIYQVEMRIQKNKTEKSRLISRLQKVLENAGMKTKTILKTAGLIIKLEDK